jgi:hypothetical protein
MINPKVTPGKPQIRIGNYHGHRLWACTVDGNITAWGPTMKGAYKQWCMTQNVSLDAPKLTLVK